jgi:hypothetical protein
MAGHRQLPVDVVSHPPHYTGCRAECIEIIEDHGWGLHYCLGNAMKYLWRCQDKGAMRQDLEKARWCIDRALGALDK